MSTTRGIQSESAENASGSSARRRRTTARRAVAGAAAPAAAEPQVERALLLGQDPDRQVEPLDERARASPSRTPPSARRSTAAGRPATSGRGGPAARMSSSSDVAVAVRTAARRRRCLERGDRARDSACRRRAAGRRAARERGRWPGSRWRPGSGAAPRATLGRRLGLLGGNSVANRSRRRASGPERASSSSARLERALAASAS